MGLLSCAPGLATCPQQTNWKSKIKAGSGKRSFIQCGHIGKKAKLILKSFFRVMKWVQSSSRGPRMCISKRSAQAVVPPTINHFHVWFSVSSYITVWKLFQGDKFLFWLVLFLSPTMRFLGKRPISLGSIFVIVRLKDTSASLNIVIYARPLTKW